MPASELPVAETLYLSTIPGAMPSKWVQRFTSRQQGRDVVLIAQDEVSQTLFLQPGENDSEPRGIPQLGYLRWHRNSSWQELLAGYDIDPEDIHLVRIYEEEPVIVVGEGHLLSAWNPELDGSVPLAELDLTQEIKAEEFASPVVDDPLTTPEIPGAGERMVIQIVASGAGYTVLPSSVARMFGEKRTVVLPASHDIHPGWEVGLAWRKAYDSQLVQDFIGVTKGRRPGSARG